LYVQQSTAYREQTENADANKMMMSSSTPVNNKDGKKEQAPGSSQLALTKA